MTCDNGKLVLFNGLRQFWLEEFGGDEVTSTHHVPKLVERCRVFEGQYIIPDEYPPLTREWRRSGIQESINTPEGRPT